MSKVCHRVKGNEHCFYHPAERVEFECEDCPGSLACHECLSTVHKRHSLKKIKMLITTKVENLNHFIRKTSSETIPGLIREIKQTINTLQEKKQKYSHEINRVKRHGEYLHKEIDLSTASKVSVLKSFLKENTEMLRSHHERLEKLQKELESDTEKCMLTIKSGNDMLVYHNESEIHNKLNIQIPKMPTLKSAVFNPCKSPKKYIEKGFGEICGDQKVVPVKEQQTNGTTNKREEAPTPDNIQHRSKFLDQPSIVNKNEAGYTVHLNSICPTPDNMAWMHGNDQKLHLIDDTCTEKKTLQLDMAIEDITTHPVTGELYCCTWKYNSVRKVDLLTGQTNKMFTVDGLPVSLACTKDDRMVVGLEDRVRTYTFTGHLLYQYTFTSDWYPHVSVCKATNRVAVALGQDGVQILTDSLKQLCSYNANAIQQDNETYLQMEKENSVVTSVFVNKYLVVGDLDGDITIINANDGRCIHKTSTEEMISGVWALGVQKNGNLWVACNDEDAGDIDDDNDEDVTFTSTIFSAKFLA